MPVHEQIYEMLQRANTKPMSLEELEEHDEEVRNFSLATASSRAFLEKLEANWDIDTWATHDKVSWELQRLAALLQKLHIERLAREARLEDLQRRFAEGIQDLRHKFSADEERIKSMEVQLVQAELNLMQAKHNPEIEVEVAGENAQDAAPAEGVAAALNNNGYETPKDLQSAQRFELIRDEDPRPARVAVSQPARVVVAQGLPHLYGPMQRPPAPPVPANLAAACLGGTSMAASAHTIGAQAQPQLGQPQDGLMLQGDEGSDLESEEENPWSGLE